MNCFRVNKELDFLRGYSEGAVFRNDRMELQKDAARAAFFSRMFDSRKDGTVWHRFTADICDAECATVRFQIYASDTDSISVDGVPMKLADYIRDPLVEMKEKKKKLDPLLKKTIYNCSDVLLFDVKGRYMFYLCEIYNRDREMPYVGDITVFFPRQTWADFLPGVYTSADTSSDFTERFLAIFQSIYDDMNRKITESPGLMNPVWAERPMLEELAGWFGIRNTYLWTDDKLRQLVLNANTFTSECGTVKGMGDILEIYLGERPEIIECFKVARSGDMGEQLEYGTDVNKYVINVKEKYLTSTRDYNALMCVVEACSPAHMSVRLRPVIEPGVRSVNSYLGINTGLGTQDKEAME